MNSPTDQAGIALHLAISMCRGALKKAVAGSQDEANVTEVLATLEPLALKFPAPKPAVPVREG